MNPRDHRLRGLSAPSAARRTTTSLRTPLLIAAGLVGVPLAIAVANYFDKEQGPPAPPPPAPPTVDTNTSYPVNHFLPGAGYYHPPFGGWFPLPFNTHDPARGWFRGGQWQSTAQDSAAEKKQSGQVSGFTSSGTGGSGARVTSSRPTPQAVQKANTGAAAQHKSNIQRGGFGSSSRPGVS